MTWHYRHQAVADTGLPPSLSRALCGYAPSADPSTTDAEAVTCQRCIDKLALAAEEMLDWPEWYAEAHKLQPGEDMEAVVDSEGNTHWMKTK